MLLEALVGVVSVVCMVGQLADGAKNSGSLSNYMHDEHDRIEKKYQDRTSSDSKRD